MTTMHWKGKCQDRGCYLAMRSDPEMFDDCWPRKISMGDIDGLVEIKGHFLLVEFKHPGQKVPDGQAIMFKKLVSHGNFTVLVVYAEQNRVLSWAISSAKGEKLQEGTTGQLQDWVRAWASWADKHPK